MQIELQRDQARIQRGHSKNMGKICSSIWKHVHTPADVQRIYDALRQIASAKSIPMPPMPGFPGGYGCHPYGGFGCDDDFGYNCQYLFGCDVYG